MHHTALGQCAITVSVLLGAGTVPFHCGTRGLRVSKPPCYSYWERPLAMRDGRPQLKLVLLSLLDMIKTSSIRCLTTLFSLDPQIPRCSGQKCQESPPGTDNQCIVFCSTRPPVTAPPTSTSQAEPPTLSFQNLSQTTSHCPGPSSGSHSLRKGRSPQNDLLTLHHLGLLPS